MKLVSRATRHLPQSARFQARRLLYAGPNHRCVLCQSQVRRFVDHGGGLAVLDQRRVVGGMRRRADKCPACHGADRMRAILAYLRQAGVGARAMKVLHVAPDFGLYLWLNRQPNVDYTASDLDAFRYRHIAGFREADLTNLPFDDESYDVMICSHVLEHVPDDRKALGEMWRVLKPGGQLLVMVPEALDGRPTDEDLSVVDPGEREQRFGQWDHVRLYSRDDLPGRLASSADFDVAPFVAADEAPDAEQLGLNPLEYVWVCTKRPRD
jgi:SAM-dependent methyltransferase